MNLYEKVITIAYLIILCIAAREDWKYQRIDSRVHLEITGLALGEMCLSLGPTWQERITGCVAVSVPMLLITVIIGRAFGGGDIKLMAASGMLLGANRIVKAGVTGIMLGGIYCVGMLIGGKIKRDDVFPLGPFLVVGLIIEKIGGCL